MKHLLVTNDFPPKIGGIQSYLWELWRRLPAPEATVLTTAYPGAEAFDAGRQQRRRRDKTNPRAHRIEDVDVRARDARMKDVAADRDREPGDAALGAAYGQCVEERLGRVLVSAISGVDDRAIDLLRE